MGSLKPSFTQGNYGSAWQFKAVQGGRTNRSTLVQHGETTLCMAASQWQGENCTCLPLPTINSAQMQYKGPPTHSLEAKALQFRLILWWQHLFGMLHKQANGKRSLTLFPLFSTAISYGGGTSFGSYAGSLMRQLFNRFLQVEALVPLLHRHAGYRHQNKRGLDGAVYGA